MKIPILPAASILVLAALAGCREEVRLQLPQEIRAEREMAYRQWCVAAYIADEADEDLEILEATLANLLQGPDAGPMSQQATGAAIEFSRAYLQHAELRASAYANLDSAVNHSATSADSARFVSRAAAFSILLPQEGTVERNVLEAWQNNFVEMLRDEDHRCNWDIPF
jgi:hypothetical protein